MNDSRTRNPPLWVFIAIALGAIFVAYGVWGRQLLLHADNPGGFESLAILSLSATAHFLSLFIGPLFFLAHSIAPFLGLRIHFESLTPALGFASLGFWFGIATILFSEQTPHSPQFKSTLFRLGFAATALSSVIYVGFSTHLDIAELPNVAATYNAFEVILWTSIGIFLFLKARNLAYRIRNLALASGFTFLLFAISDAVEIRTGAWWSPWWLLLWKVSCIVSFGVIYLRLRRMTSPNECAPQPPDIK